MVHADLQVLGGAKEWSLLLDACDTATGNVHLSGEGQALWFLD